MAIWFRWLGVLCLVGCGPSILDIEDDDAESTTTTTTTTTTGTTAVPPADTGTTAVPTADTGTTGVGSEDSSGPGVSFIEDPEGSCLCFECDVFAQDCPIGEKCMPWANDGGDLWNATRCTEVDDMPAGPGEPCMVEGSGVSGIDTCDLAAMCWEVDPESLQGVCVAMCGGDKSNPQCARGLECLIAGGGDLTLCLSPCDPLLAEDCAPGQGCIPGVSDFVCGSMTAVPAEVGQPCSLVGSCAPGLACIDSQDAGPPCDPMASDECCAPYCDLSQPDPDATCPEPGQQCLGHADWPAGADAGYCVNP